nr:hypothetical protein [Halorussus sp. MSC15.2]
MNVAALGEQALLFLQQADVSQVIQLSADGASVQLEMVGEFSRGRFSVLHEEDADAYPRLGDTEYFPQNNG